MTLIEKFSKLELEKRKEFSTIKDGEGLEAFLRQTELVLSSEEKEQILEYIASGRLPLADEELESVAGGGCSGIQQNPDKPLTIPNHLRTKIKSRN